MNIKVSVDTNDYNADEPHFPADHLPEWSLMKLNLATFQDWSVGGQSATWTIDGDTFCGTIYTCDVNYRDSVLLRSLINKIKQTCADRLITIWIGDLEVKWIEDMMEMSPVWLETMKSA